MSKQSDFIRAPVFGISEDELATGAVNDNEIGTISGKKIKSHSITSDQMAAGSVGALQLQAGAITAFKITVPNRVKGTTVVFSVSDTSPDTLQWTSGVAYLMKMKYTPGDTMGDLQVVQVQQTISAGSYQFKAGDDAYYFYVEWETDQDSDEPADSATLEVQKSETYPESDTAIVLAYAWYDPILGLAQFQALDTAGGGVKISGNSIISGSIISQNIRSGTITTDKLAFPAFDKSKDTLDSIADGVTYKKVSSAQISTFIDGSNRAITYISSDGKYQTILQSTAYANPSQSGLYLTAQHLGFYNATLGGWTVDIRSTGEMFLGSQYNNQYLYWDGQTLTVKGNVEANSIVANVSITSPYITLSGSGYIAGGKGSFTDTNNGFWLGYYYGNYVFNIGNSSQYIRWDGTTLTVTGNVQANSVVANISITSPYITLNSSGYIAGGKSYFTDANSGFWLGYYNGYYTFIIGNSSQYLKWDGTTLTVRGDVQATSVAAGAAILSPTIMGGTITTSPTGSGQRVQLSSNAYSAIDFYDAGNNHVAQILGDAYLTINSYYYGITLTPNYSGGYGVLVQGILKVSHPYGLAYTKIYLGDSDYIYTDGLHIYWNHNGTDHQLD